LTESRPGIDPRLEELCLKALAKNPADRFSDCRAFADALRQWQSGSQAVAAPDPNAKVQSASGNEKRPRAAVPIARAIAPAEAAPSATSPSTALSNKWLWVGIPIAIVFIGIFLGVVGVSLYLMGGINSRNGEKTLSKNVPTMPDLATKDNSKTSSRTRPPATRNR